MRLIDCDVHVRWRSPEELAEHMVEPWRTYLLTNRFVHPHNNFPNPVQTRRADAVPPAGGSPGSDPAFLVEDLLERYGIDRAVLVGESSQLAISTMPNADAAAAYAAAYNDWLRARWLAADERLLGSIFVPAQDPPAAAREVDRVADHPRMVQVALGSGARMPYGQRFYDPLYEAAGRHGLPVAIHPLNEGAGTCGAPSPVGWPSHYIEYHTCAANAAMSHLASLVFEGTFERFPDLRVVFIEFGLSWIPGFLWRMDRNWRSLRSSVPWVKQPPSEYVRERVRFTTQPLAEPDDRQDLRRLLSMFPADEMLLFSSDYPHWDFDDPARVRERLPEHLRQRVCVDNPRALYGL